MKENHQLRCIALKLGVSGTALPIAETRLYKGSYGFVKLHAYVPKTQNTEAPVCTAFCTTIDELGREKISTRNYNLMYIGECDLEGKVYLRFESDLPKEFTKNVTSADGLKITLNYYDTEIITNEQGEAVLDSRGVPKRYATDLLVSSTYTTTVHPGGWNEEDIELNTNSAEVGQIVENMRNIAEIQEEIDGIKSNTDSAHANSREALEISRQAKDTADGLADSIAQANANASQAVKTADGAVEDIAEYKTQIDKAVEYATNTANGLADSIAQANTTAERAVATANDAVATADRAEAIAGNAVSTIQEQHIAMTAEIDGLRKDIINEGHFRGLFKTVNELETAHPTATPNDYAYIVGGNQYIYQDDRWIDTGQQTPVSAIPPSTLTPVMDGSASAGISQAYARGDHRHPSDTSKVNKSGDTMTGPLTAPTLAGDNGVFDSGERVYSPNNPPPISNTQVKSGTAEYWENINPVLEVGEIGYDTTNKLTKIGDGVTSWEDLAWFMTETPPKIPFAEATWEKINRVAQSGKAAEYFNVGDEKVIELSTGEQITLVILGFDHDELTSGSGKASITVGMKEILSTIYPMDTGYVYNTWEKCAMRTKTLPMLFSQLPIGLQSIIKPVDKKTAVAGKAEKGITSDKLFLLSCSEMLSEEGVRSSCTESNIGEGIQYEYWRTVKNGDVSSDRKKDSTDKRQNCIYWLRSRWVEGGGTSCFSVNNGGIGSEGQTYYKGVSFCFCI